MNSFPLVKSFESFVTKDDRDFEFMGCNITILLHFSYVIRKVSKSYTVKRIYNRITLIQEIMIM